MTPVKLHKEKVSISAGRPVKGLAPREDGYLKTCAGQILSVHDENGARGASLSVKFDSLVSHDITYVGIIQTAVSGGLDKFPVPYALTNCHNSLCAVGGTINADDHLFGLSAARRFGGIYVPPNLAVIHQYAREEMASAGGMVLGSDSHTRYGAIGAMGVGEGGGELVKQLLGDRWEVPRPEIVLVWLKGSPRRGVGPHDVAIALCGAVYKNNFVKNKILEFAGPGVSSLDIDFRLGIDVMTTETAALSSIWPADGAVEEFYAVHGRPEVYRPLSADDGAEYSAMVEIDLDAVEPMAAMPFHPSEAITVRELKENPGDILREVGKRARDICGGRELFDPAASLEGGKIRLRQGVIAGCAGGMYGNIAEAAAILEGRSCGCGEFELVVYPSSVPVDMEVSRTGLRDILSGAGAVMKTCFCGPCFGAGDVPANNTLSARHTTRNFPNREGSRPGDAQLAAVMLMDARSIAATAANGGFLTGGDEIDYRPRSAAARSFDRKAYSNRVYCGFGRADASVPLRYAPNIVPWPEMPAMAGNVLFRVASVLRDPVTTTDELIPSGETSSYRSNPPKLARFALSRRDPAYVGRAEEVMRMESERAAGSLPAEAAAALEAMGTSKEDVADMQIASLIYAEKPGDGSAREQAASCQKILGGGANICREYATKRYRSNCINWGLVPFTLPEGETFGCEPGAWIFARGLRKAVESGAEEIAVKVFSGGKVSDMRLSLAGLTSSERRILLAGSLMNDYKNRKTR